MTYTADSRQLAALARALKEPPSTRPINHAALVSGLKRQIKDGWIRRSALDDLLVAMDHRLDQFEIGQLDALIKLFGFSWTNITSRPRKSSSGVVLLPALLPAQVASFLSLLEALGFRVDPKPLMDLLLPSISKQKTLTNAELSVFWYDRTRHKGEPLTLAVPRDDKADFDRCDEWKTSAGYKLSAWFDRDGNILQLTARAPRYRARAQPVEVTCPVCAYTYYLGDPDSSLEHRREHRRRMHYLAPQPNAQLLAALERDGGAAWVTSNSPVWMHREMYLRAAAFRREFGYDFVQWGSDTGDNDPAVQGHLFSGANGAIIGACAFRLRRFDDDRSCWGLQWVWFAPSQRRTGQLAKQWSSLRERFGDFYVEGPVSHAMQAFLAKHGDTHLMDLSTCLASGPQPSLEPATGRG